VKISKREKIFLSAILLIFILLRLPGLNFSYYQDENTWIRNVQPGSLGEIPHPPGSEIVFRLTMKFFGEDHFRFTPFLFSILNLCLLYIYTRKKFGNITALIAVSLLTVSFYNLLASLMVDTDGQILPFFFLLSLLAYDRFSEQQILRKRIIWLCILGLVLMMGIMVKLSFAIVIFAIFADFIFSIRNSLDVKKILKFFVFGAVAIVLLLIIFLNLKRIYPAFKLGSALTYWQHFVILSGRNYLQVIIQVMKAILYASPLTIVPLIFLNRDYLKKIRIFIIFLLTGLFFYLVAFDFSSGALDRYFQFIIIPLCIISAVIYTDIFLFQRDSRKPYFAAICVGIAIFLLQFIPHYVPALYPKTEWFQRALSLRWNFVFPFTGGSGPMGFYVSSLFMGLIWLISFMAALILLLRRNINAIFIALIIVLGIIYNGVFIEEYLVGAINGNSKKLLASSIERISRDNSIREVITYNNIGYAELAKIGKYRRRMYVAPKFEKSYIDIFNNFKGYYLVIDIPRIDSGSLYSRFLNSCKPVFSENSQKINSTLYDCKKSVNF
jgi:hypothetical protein